MKRSIAMVSLSILLLSGCTQQADVMEPTAEEAAKVNPQTQALEAATQAGLISEDVAVGLSEQEALQQVAGAVDEAQYDVEATEETLSVGADAASAREYYVFVVSDTTGRTVGKVAVDRETGEKYNYLGDGVLDDYATFPLYDAEAEQHKGWPGSYVSPAGVTLTITQEEETGIVYCFSDGTEGTAAVNGETAKSADEQMNFLLADGIVTVAGGGLTGNYIAQ
ncbi:hypothetical protein ACTQ34_01465 [Agathobaculum sp. LCP25S3_E8]|uniref:hypothetical protein n=1 Tax=Agathobaculum sp. LCP25S3_E8 TaxID=3438735 RepID=UPI003F8F3DC3